MPRVNLTADAIALLRDRNHLDIELYQHAAHLAERLTEAATDALKGEKLRAQHKTANGLLTASVTTAAVPR